MGIDDTCVWRAAVEIGPSSILTDCSVDGTGVAAEADSCFVVGTSFSESDESKSEEFAFSVVVGFCRASP